jgi:hypothetical protein
VPVGDNEGTVGHAPARATSQPKNRTELTDGIAGLEVQGYDVDRAGGLRTDEIALRFGPRVDQKARAQGSGCEVQNSLAMLEV